MMKTMRGRGRWWLFGKDDGDKRKKKNHVENGYLGKKMEIRGRKRKSRDENGKGKWNRKKNWKKRKRKPIIRIEKKKKEINKKILKKRKRKPIEIIEKKEKETNRNNWEIGTEETTFFFLNNSL